jgi:hypothetical protein
MPRSWLGHDFGPALFLSVPALQPRPSESGEIWQEIAGGVNEDHREQIFRSGPDDTESHSADCQNNDRIGDRVERAGI